MTRQHVLLSIGFVLLVGAAIAILLNRAPRRRVGRDPAQEHMTSTGLRARTPEENGVRSCVFTVEARNIVTGRVIEDVSVAWGLGEPAPVIRRNGPAIVLACPSAATEMCIRAPGYEDVTARWTSGGTQQVVAHLVPVKDVELLVASADGSPVPYATITVRQPKASAVDGTLIGAGSTERETDSTGRASIRVGAWVPCTVVAEAPGFVPLAVEVPVSQRFLLLTLSEGAAIFLRWPKHDFGAGVVDVSISNAHGVQERIQRTVASLRAASGDTYLLTLRPDTYQAAVSVDGAAVHRAAIVARHGERIIIDVLADGAESGRRRDVKLVVLADGPPIPVRVAARGTGTTLVSEILSGEARAVPVPTDATVLTFSAPGYMTSRHELPKSAEVVTVRMERQPSVTVRLAFPSGAVNQTLRCRLSRKDVTYWEDDVTVSEDRLSEPMILPVGEVQLCIRTPSQPVYCEPLFIIAGSGVAHVRGEGRLVLQRPEAADSDLEVSVNSLKGGMTSRPESFVWVAAGISTKRELLLRAGPVAVTVRAAGKGVYGLSVDVIAFSTVTVNVDELLAVTPVELVVAEGVLRPGDKVRLTPLGSTGTPIWCSVGTDGLVNLRGVSLPGTYAFHAGAQSGVVRLPGSGRVIIGDLAEMRRLIVRSPYRIRGYSASRGVGTAFAAKELVSGEWEVQCPTREVLLGVSTPSGTAYSWIPPGVEDYTVPPIEETRFAFPADWPEVEAGAVAELLVLDGKPVDTWLGFAPLLARSQSGSIVVPQIAAVTAARLRGRLTEGDLVLFGSLPRPGFVGESKYEPR